MVDLVNRLPKPLSLPCFLQNFPRPLKLFAMQSRFSAQQSAGPNNPRVFIINGDLMLSVVTYGLGSEALELSYKTGEGQSIKGEIYFPLTENITEDHPYTSIETGGGTACRFCHLNERPSPDYPNAFESDLTLPDPFERMSLTRLDQLTQECNPEEDQTRCDMFTSLFGDRRFQQGDFPE